MSDGWLQVVSVGLVVSALLRRRAMRRRRSRLRAWCKVSVLVSNHSEHHLQLKSNQLLFGLLTTRVSDKSPGPKAAGIYALLG